MIEHRSWTIMRQSLAIIAVLAATAYAIPECPPQGLTLIPHTKDCGLYYECNQGSLTEKECPGGLSFDPVKSICSWPPRSECSTQMESPDSECPADSEIAKRHPHDCSCAKYYECVGGMKVLQECNNGTNFDYLREVCDVPEKVKCYSENAVMDVQAQQDNDCPATGHIRIPHESDCNYYYNCDNGRKYLGKCLEGHHFNALVQQCDLRENANCDGKKPITTTPRIVDVDECPACNCDCYTRFPHNNCSLYYECYNGKKTVKECPEGLYFNPLKETCDWPDNVDCKMPGVCTIGNRTHHECNCHKYYECHEVGWVMENCPQGTQFDYERNECVTSDKAECWPPKEPEGCMDKCLPNEHKIVAHENCKQYCKCENGHQTIVVCDENMFYNPDKQKCDWPESVRHLKCTPFPCLSNSTNVTIPHECVCNIYYECENGVEIRKECPLDSEYNYELGQCTSYERSHCYKEIFEESTIESESCMGVCPKLDPSDRSFVLPHRNCTKFCRCGSEAPYVVHCKPGLHFSTQKGICVEPELAKCNRLYMYGFEERDLDTTANVASSWKNILPFFNN